MYDVIMTWHENRKSKNLKYERKKMQIATLYKVRFS